MADKNRKLQEKAHRMKEESLRDDDNVFDVAFENQGGEAAEHTVSATDIKVCTTASHHSGQHTFAAAASSYSCSTRIFMHLPKYMLEVELLWCCFCAAYAPVIHMLTCRHYPATAHHA